MACRTLTSTIRLLETQQLFRGDSRIHFVFTVDSGSKFSSGARQLLEQAGVLKIIDWSEVDGVRPDLTLSASENIEPDTVGGDVVLLPHGVGFDKYVPTSDGTGRRVAGLPSAAALRGGRMLVVLAHSEQERLLRTVRPEIAGNTVVTGDPTLDRLDASLPLADRYRRLLHAEDRRLVLVSSTWGPESTYRVEQGLPNRLLASLPADEYRICLALHPNIWSYYGRSLHLHLGAAVDGGLVLLPPELGWQPAMVAADLVVADHGSLGMYAAALGKPLLLAGHAAETVPGTPTARLAEVTAQLDPRVSVADQIDQALCLPAENFRHITDRVFDHRGRASELLRAELYRALDLTPPDEEAPVLRIPDPQAELHGPHAWRVLTHTSGDTVRLFRYPATVRPADGATHLVVTEAEYNLLLLERASVLCREHRSDHARAHGWLTTTLAGFPGARLAAAAVPEGCLVLVRDGRRAVVLGDADVPALASVAYHCLLEAGALSGRWTLSLARQQFQVEIRAD